jgi:gliding motility-associated-like protein
VAVTLLKLFFSMKINRPALKLIHQVYIVALFFGLAQQGFSQDVPSLAWAKVFSGTLSETPTGIAIDLSGNVYTTGYFGGTTDFDPGAGVFNLTSVGSQDIFISKIDVNGNFVWAKSMGGTGTDNGNAIAVDVAGNVYTTGFFNNTVDFDPGAGTFNLISLGSAEIFISKIDTDGNFVWAKSAGGTDYQQANAITLDASGNVYTTGYFFGTTDFDPSPGTFNITPLTSEDVFILKLDNNGNFVWAKSFEGNSTERGKSIAVDASGNVYTTGYIFNGTIDLDPGAGVFSVATTSFRGMFISKLDLNGNFVWGKGIAGATSIIESESLELDNSGNILITGSFSGVADFDTGLGVFNLTADSGTSFADIFILKLDTNGDLVWAKSIGPNSNYQIGTSIVSDASGNVYTTGRFEGITDFDPGAGTYNLTSAGGADIFISCLDVNGNFAWALRIGGSGTSGDTGTSINIDALGNVHVTGSFFSTLVDFDFGPCVFNVSNTGFGDGFIEKISIGAAIPPPTIASFTPASGPVGTPVTIAGTNFSTTPTENDVRFFNNRIATVSASTSTSINTAVPASAITGRISVTSNCITVQSATDFVVIPSPTITSFTPTNGQVNTNVTISGTNFSTTPANNTVQFNGTTAIVTASTATTITTKVPNGATTGKITVTVAGITATSASDFTVLIAGQETPTLEWAKRIGGTGAAGEQIIDAKADVSGNVYVIGFFTSLTDFDPGAGTFNLTPTSGVDIFVAKYDADGNFVWAKSIGGNDPQDEVAEAIELDNAGNVFITGHFYGTVDFDPGSGVFNLTSGGSADMFIVKLASTGDFVWAGSVGGIGYDKAFAIALDASDNVFTTGYFLSSSIDFDPGAGSAVLSLTGQQDAFVLKLDNNGNYQWAKKFGNTETERGHTIAIDGSGNVIITGGFSGYTASFDFDPGPATFTLTPNTTSGQSDIYICKLSNATGDITWAKAITGTLTDKDEALATDNSDNILLTGYYQATTDFDPGPGIFSLTVSGANNPFIVKLNSSGDFVWAKSMSGPTIGADSRGDNIATDAFGNVYASGQFQGTVDFDPGAGVFNLVAVGQSDAYFTKLNASGDFVWAYRIGSSGFDFGLSIALAPAGKFYALGSFSTTADFDPGACTFNQTSSGGYDAFIQKIAIGTLPAPLTISSFSPTSGAVGTTVTITGTNFSTTPSNNAVLFNTTSAAVSASTSTTITTTVPTGATTGRISVTVGCLTNQSLTNFTIGTPVLPTITSFTPPSGPVGTMVTITGTNFSTTAANNTVAFNGTTAVVTASTTTSITTTVPTGATTGTITVTVAGNTATSATNFTVTPPLPTITSFTPTSGTVGTTVIITGTNFDPTAINNIVAFNGTTAVVTASTTTSITTTVPTGATTGTITVAVAGNTATSATNFIVTPPLPTVTSFTPTSGPVGTTVTITGTNFDPIAINNIVAFNGTTAVVTASTTTSITTTVPTGATTGTITVTVSGNTATSATNFTVTPPLPTIISFTPTSGPVGTTVFITGTNFDPTPVNNIVAFNGTNSVVTASTTTSITTTVPTGATTGTITVTVAGNTATSATNFTVTPPLPTITLFTPSSGPVGTTVTITGTNFDPTAINNIVAFNGTTAVVTASTTTSITTTLPTGATTGKITVAVAGNTATSASDFTVTTLGGTVTITTEPLTTSIGGTVTKNLVSLITTLNNNLDINSITVIEQPPSGALASIVNGMLMVDYSNISFSGKESITISACDTDGNCGTQQFEIEVAGEIIVYNGISPNNDAQQLNEKFIIQYIDLLPETQNNKVTIYNRWGDAVWEGANYNNQSVVFTGKSNNGNELPTGTYFYKIQFNSNAKTATGYLSIKK